MRLLLGILVLWSAAQVQSAEIISRIENAPESGRIVIQVYDSANTFGDFRSPVRQERYTVQPDGIYTLRNLPAGNFAVLAYADENDNGVLDRNFIGIPKEPLGLSNNYRPKGPPNFERASVYVDDDDVLTLDFELYKVLGNTGQWGLGLGVIGRASPYTGSNSAVVKVIPAITYFGERLQWIGPELRYGLAGSGDLRLAFTASYRIGAYEEDDSPMLAGLGDRESTLLAGLGLVYEVPGGAELDVRYERDVLNRIGGSAATVKIARGFQAGNVRLVPQLGINWLNKDFANYEFGVPASAVQPGRPAYSVGSSISTEAGIRSLVELSENWRIAFSFSAEFLDDDVTDSPIVDADRVIKGFAALTYSF